MHQCSRDRDLHALTLRKRPRKRLGGGVQSELLDEFTNPRVEPAAVQSAKRTEVADVLAHRQPSIEAMDVWKHAERGRTVAVPAADLDPAGIRPEQPGDDPERGRFPGAIRSEEARD